MQIDSIKKRLRTIPFILTIYRKFICITKLATFLLNARKRIVLSQKDIHTCIQKLSRTLPYTSDEIVPFFYNPPISLLGTPPCNIFDIKWNSDVISGTEWKFTTPSFLISYGTGMGDDIKIPWEFSRMYFLPQIASSYVKTGDKEYAKACIEILTDWIQKNKPYYGPNWMNAMEVGIRVSNWCVMFWLLDSFFKKNRDTYADFLKLFINSCWQHGKYIIDNLEYGPTISNHYLANLVGLLYVSVTFPWFRESNIWSEKARVGLEECMKRQVYDDGIDFESSISYHRLVTELFGYATRLGIHNNIIFSREYLIKLEKMFDFVWQYTKPNNQAPQIGDNDNGRLHIFEKNISGWNVNDHTHLFLLARKLWPDKEWQEKKSILFPNGQIAILRSEKIYCIIDGGQNGQNGNGGHCHNDIGSFELNVCGRDFIIDPGTYAYTSNLEARNLFRSTKMHNTVCIDNEEQNRIPSPDKGVFWMHDDARPKITQWYTDSIQDIFEVTHDGYQRLSNPVRHLRKFKLTKDGNFLEITDSFIGAGEHHFEWNFYLHPNVYIEIENQKIVLRNGVIILMFEYSQSLDYTVFDTLISPCYGIKIKTKKITFFFSGNVSNIKFFFYIDLRA